MYYLIIILNRIFMIILNSISEREANVNKLTKPEWRPINKEIAL